MFNTSFVSRVCRCLWLLLAGISLAPQTAIAQVAVTCDLSIHKTMALSTASNVLTASQGITVVNQGNAPCTAGAGPAATLRENRVAELDFSSVITRAPAGWRCSLDPAGNLQCNTDSPVAPGARMNFTFSYRVTSNSGTIRGCATISSAADTSPGNNQSCATVQVSDTIRGPVDDTTWRQASPDLAVATTLQGTLAAGQLATYVVTVTNAGRGPTAGPIVLTTTLPGDSATARAAGTGWTCAVAGRTATCRNPGPLGSGQSNRLPFYVKPSGGPGQGIRICATVATAGDASRSNDQGCHTGTIER